MKWTKEAIEAARAQITYIGEPPSDEEIEKALDAAWEKQSKYLWPDMT